jgi:ribosomal protein L37AE/L43A
MIDLGRCPYCGSYAAPNKQGIWAPACSGCKGSLTKMLRSGKYGPTYNKATKARLLKARYSFRTRRWTVPT